jgi:hypothetical protein
MKMVAVFYYFTIVINLASNIDISILKFSDFKTHLTGQSVSAVRAEA